MSRETRNHLIWICLLWVIFSLIGEWLVQMAIDNWPLIASSEGVVTSDAIFILLRAVVPIFTLVVLIVVYSSIRFRVPDNDTSPADAQYGTGRLFTFSWVGLSVILNITFIIYPGVTGLSTLWSEARAADKADPLSIEVTAKQWEWDFSYAGYKISTVNNLVVPVGRPIKFILRSDDVMHSFWVPAWGVKKAVIPGETRTLVITPSVKVTTAEDPTARVQCAQICGAGHPLMRGGLKVVSKDDFAAWVKDQQAKAENDKMNMKGMDMSGGGSMNMSGSNSKSMDMSGSGPMNMSGNGSGSMTQGSGGGMNMPGSDSGSMDMSGSGSMNMSGKDSGGMTQGSGGGMNMSGGSGSQSMDMSGSGSPSNSQ